MCEIAIINPREYGVQEIADAARKLYDSMGSSLGILAVYNSDGSFEYEHYKAVVPDYDDVFDFIEGRKNCYRFFIHGRLRTHGDTTVETAHPIEIECDECSLDYVMHNGVVRNHEMDRRADEAAGHDYKTNVDTEVIPHHYGHVPYDVDDFAEMNKYSWQSSFILFGTSRIAIFARGNSYALTGDAEMARPHRDFSPTDETSYNYVLVNAVTEDN